MQQRIVTCLATVSHEIEDMLSQMIAMYRFLKYMNNLNKPIIFQNYEYQLMNDILYMYSIYEK